MTATAETTTLPRTVLRTDHVLEESPEAQNERVPHDPKWPALVGRVLVSLALLAAWAVTYLFVLSSFPQARAQKGLYAQLRTELAQGLAPVQQPVSVGAPIALLQIPSIGMHDAVVVEGTSATQLQDGPGHFRSSSLPGQVGVTVLMGRSLSYGAPFGSLATLRPGDAIHVTTGQGNFTYRVRDLRRRGDPVPPAVATGSARLTLVTASGDGALAALSPGTTLYVDADMTGTAQPRAGTPVAVEDSELPMGIDTSVTTLTELVLALQLFIAVLVGVAWASSRWSKMLVRVIAVPTVLASLWLVSDIATRLLPNLM